MRVLIALMLMAMVAMAATPTVSSAEATDTVCATVLQTALVVLESMCSNLQPGNVCLGYPGVQPSFLNGDTGSPFGQSGQQLALTRLSKLRSEAMNIANGRLGLAAFSFAVPNSTPAAVAATGLMIGDVEMNLTSYSITVKTAYKGNSDQCQQSPAMLILRSPDNTEATLYVNGAMLLLNGMVAIHYQSANSASFIVQQGSIQIVGGPAAQAGSTLVAITDNTGTVMTWSAARPMNDKESQLLASLQSLTGTFKNFAIAPVPAAPLCSAVSHVVASGETLYSIARQFNSSVQAIIEANHIANPDAIAAGQVLTVPCATGSPNEAVPVNNAPNNGGNNNAPNNTPNNNTPTGGGGTDNGTAAQPSQPVTVPCGDLSAAVTSSFDGIANSFPSGSLPVPAAGGGLPCN